MPVEAAEGADVQVRQTLVDDHAVHGGPLVGGLRPPPQTDGLALVPTVWGRRIMSYVISTTLPRRAHRSTIILRDPLLSNLDPIFDIRGDSIGVPSETIARQHESGSFAPVEKFYCECPIDE